MNCLSRGILDSSGAPATASNEERSEEVSNVLES